jgi:DNA-binding protein
MTILEAFGKSRLETLKATGRAIAEAIDAGVPPRDLAALSKRLVDIQAEIEGLKVEDVNIVTAVAKADLKWNA